MLPGVVLPVLGALPDTLIVGVSGLGGGSAEEVQHELAVGIGTLAGSTVRFARQPLCVRTPLPIGDPAELADISIVSQRLL